MRATLGIAIVYAALLGTKECRCDDSTRVPLRVLYLGRKAEEPRAAAFETFFAERFASFLSANRDEFERASLANVDVVVVDWSQQEQRDGKYESPLGPMEQWDKPTVLLGSAGLLMAGPWSVIGGAG